VAVLFLGFPAEALLSSRKMCSTPRFAVVGDRLPGVAVDTDFFYSVPTRQRSNGLDRASWK